MKKSKPSILVPVIGGILLIAVGVIFLLTNLSVIELRWELLVGPLFGIGGIVFLLIFIVDKKDWWALIPGFILIAIGMIIFMDRNLSGFADDWGGLIFLGLLGCAFLLIYVLHPQNWWSIIPAGVLLTLGGISLIPEENDWLIGGTFFIGLALTFGLVYILPKPAGKLKWALYPGGILLILGIASLLGVERLINFVGPLILLAVGGFFVYRALRKKN